MTFYNRQVSVIVGPPGGEGREITGLRISFEVTKDDTSAPNRAKITIYNLSADTAALLKRPGAAVQLFGGYSGQTNLLFVGDVTRAITTIEGADSRTVIESGDGQAALSSATSTVNLKGKTDVGNVLKQVIKGVVSDPKATLSGLSEQVKKQVVPRGFSASGPTKTILRGLARARGFDWAYQDGQLVILDRDSATREAAVLLSPDTGLVGSPARLTTAGAKGIQFQSLLNGRIRPRRIVRLESASFTGYFLVRKVTHRGDSGFAPDFFTVIEATEIAP
jgi:hypothetical protein